MYKSKKREEFDFDEGYFFRLKRNQKLAILNFLSVIAASDSGTKLNRDEADFINHCYKIFRVTGDQFLEYIAIGGREQTVQDLKKMNNGNFLGLIMVTAELCNLNGGTSEDEFEALKEWLDDLKMTVDEWVDYVVEVNLG